MEFKEDANSTPLNLIGSDRDQYQTKFYYSKTLDFSMNDSDGDEKFKELLDADTTLEPGDSFPSELVGESGIHLYVVYLYKGLTAVVKVGTFNVDAPTPVPAPTPAPPDHSNSLPSVPDAPSVDPDDTADPYKLTDDTKVYNIFTETGDADEAGAGDAAESKQSVKKSRKLSKTYGVTSDTVIRDVSDDSVETKTSARKSSKKSARASNAYEIDSDTNIHDVPGGGGGNTEKPAEEAPKEQKVVDEFTESIVNNLITTMEQSNMTLSSMPFASMQQAAFALTPMASTGPSYPTTLPAILDYNEDGRLTVIDLSYIMSYLAVDTVLHCYSNNLSDHRLDRRKRVEAWPASEWYTDAPWYTGP